MESDRKQEFDIQSVFLMDHVLPFCIQHDHSRMLVGEGGVTWKVWIWPVTHLQRKERRKNVSNRACHPPSDLAPSQFKSPTIFILRHDRGEQSRSLYFISFPYFLPSNHVVVTIETGGEKKRKASEERVYNLNTYFLSSCACLRVGRESEREMNVDTKQH